MAKQAQQNTKARKTVFGIPLWGGAIIFAVLCIIGTRMMLSLTKFQLSSLAPGLTTTLNLLNPHLPLVSIITPTKSSRHRFHKSLYECFNAQTYPNKELIVLDEGDETSAFFSSLNDMRVRYIPQTKIEPVGKKRNVLVEAARGEIIVHFDDDDFYSDQYVEWMVWQLNEKSVSLVTLSGIFLYGSQDQYFGFWDKTIDSSLVPPNPLSLILTRDTGKVSIRNGVFSVDDQYIYGFGFSYVYLRSMATALNGFDASMRLGEDYDFVQRARKNGFKLAAVPDTRGLALKTFHRDCSSNLLTQFKLPNFLVELLFGRRVLQYV